MFYQKKQVENCLVCSACNSLFLDPRTLPCGHVFCQQCIEDDLQDNKTVLVCKDCKTKHESSNGGFPANLIVKKLLDLKADYVVQSECSRELRIKLDLLNKGTEELNKYLTNGVVEIQNRCSKLRNQIDVQIEIRIDELQDLRDEMISEVNDYEQKSIEIHEESLKINEDRLSEYVKETAQFYKTSLDYLSQFEVDEKKLSKLTVQTVEYLNSLRDIDTHLLMNRKIEFIRSETKLSRDLVGSFKTQDHSANWFGIGFKSNDIKDISGISSIVQLQCSSDKVPDLYAICMNAQQEYELVRFDGDGTINFHRALFKKEANITNKVSVLSLLITEKNIFFKFNNVALCNASMEICGTMFALDPSKKSFVVKLDFNFNPIRFQQCNRFIRKMVANSSFVFIHFMNSETLSVFDHELSPFNRTFTARYLQDLAVTDKYLFVLDKDQESLMLKIVDIENDFVIKQIDQSEISFGQLKAVGNEFVVLRDNNSGLVRVYNQDKFELFKQVNFMPGFSMSNDSSCFLTFSDKCSFLCVRYLLRHSPSIDI